MAQAGGEGQKEKAGETAETGGRESGQPGGTGRGTS